ncbi:MAG TPA: HlyD family efflux transporter periplasmic adaptor subunit [Epsilonproteobacteria bacterium]|nr:HlyD family efflux transporter periplasmic adaptor subunit [Campylobacterota bacterium]
MTKYLLLLLPLLGFSSAIKVEHATLRPLGTMIHTNAQITQLSSEQQDIVSRLSGHLERYYVQAGQYVKGGEKIALIESIELSKMTAEYLALIQQAKAAEVQKNASMKLNQKGLSSQNDLSNAIIALQEIRSKQNALASQLKSLSINPTTLTEATDKFIIYAHADGVVGKIIAPLHSNVDAQTLLMTLVNQSNYHAVAYIGVKDAMKITNDTKGWINIADKKYPSIFIQLLPSIDPETQRAKVLFSIENSPSNLLLGAFNQMDISVAPYTDAVMVKKSALSLFKGEWVVFVEKEHEEAGHHDEKADHDHDGEKAEHDAHDHEAHDTDKGHDEHASHDDDDEGHEEHGEHEEHEEAPYAAKVVEIIAYAGDYVAIKGLKVNEEYVSDGVYFVKSMILKSSLGEHGH